MVDHLPAYRFFFVLRFKKHSVPLRE